MLTHQVISYLFFGGLTTLVYLTVRFLVFAVTQNALMALLIANATAILFAFVVNDRLVFAQAQQGWPGRLVKFVTARLSTLLLDALLTLIFVTSFPQIVGQFVHHDPQLIDTTVALFSQVLIIVGNYFISKFLIFTDNTNKTA